MVDTILVAMVTRTSTKSITSVNKSLLVKIDSCSILIKMTAVGAVLPLKVAVLLDLNGSRKVNISVSPLYTVKKPSSGRNSNILTSRITFMKLLKKILSRELS